MNMKQGFKVKSNIKAGSELWPRGCGLAGMYGDPVSRYGECLPFLAGSHIQVVETCSGDYTPTVSFQTCYPDGCTIDWRTGQPDCGGGSGGGLAPGRTL